jgi:hypothetical protein
MTKEDRKTDIASFDFRSISKDSEKGAEKKVSNSSSSARRFVRLYINRTSRSDVSVHLGELSSAEDGCRNILRFASVPVNASFVVMTEWNWTARDWTCSAGQVSRAWTRLVPSNSQSMYTYLRMQSGGEKRHRCRSDKRRA